MKTALLLIAHGSREPEANADLQYVADGLRRLGHPIVEASFLELAEPDIEEGGCRCVAGGARRVVLLPYFLSAGVHVRRDLTQACVQLSARFPEVEFRLAEPLGRHPLLLEVVAERAREASGYGVQGGSCDLEPPGLSPRSPPLAEDGGDKPHCSPQQNPDGTL